MRIIQKNPLLVLAVLAVLAVVLFVSNCSENSKQLREDKSERKILLEKIESDRRRINQLYDSLQHLDSISSETQTVIDSFFASRNTVEILILKNQHERHRKKAEIDSFDSTDVIEYFTELSREYSAELSQE